MCKWFIEVVQDLDGSYYANMIINGKPVRNLKENVDYNTLREDIRSKTGIEILKRNKMKFQQSGRKKYAYIDATQERSDCRVTLDEVRNGWEPKFDSVSTEPYTAVDEFLNHDKSFRYQLLDRLRSDCEYYLGYGNRHAPHLWAKDEAEHIACMKALWNSFSPEDKPSFLTMEKIQEFEKQMVSIKPSLSSMISGAESKVSESGNLTKKREDHSEFSR